VGITELPQRNGIDKVHVALDEGAKGVFRVASGIFP
jgi:hypothetical protein